MPLGGVSQFANGSEVELEPGFNYPGLASTPEASFCFGQVPCWAHAGSGPRPLAKLVLDPHLGASKNQGPLLCSPFNKDHSIFGCIFGGPTWKLPFRALMLARPTDSS